MFFGCNMFVKKKKEKTNFYKIKMYMKKCGCFVNTFVLRIEVLHRYITLYKYTVMYLYKCLFKLN